MKNIRFHDSFRNYIRPTDLATGNRLTICAKRIISIHPIGNHTCIDCGKTAGFESYTVIEPLHTIRKMLETIGL